MDKKRARLAHFEKKVQAIRDEAAKKRKEREDDRVRRFGPRHVVTWDEYKKGSRLPY